MNSFDLEDFYCWPASSTTRGSLPHCLWSDNCMPFDVWSWFLFVRYVWFTADCLWWYIWPGHYTQCSLAYKNVHSVDVFCRYLSSLLFIKNYRNLAINWWFSQKKSRNWDPQGQLSKFCYFGQLLSYLNHVIHHFTLIDEEQTEIAENVWYDILWGSKLTYNWPCDYFKSEIIKSYGFLNLKWQCK